jgi:hypothetical protein
MGTHFISDVDFFTAPIDTPVIPGSKCNRFPSPLLPTSGKRKRDIDSLCLVMDFIFHLHR